MRCRSIGWYPDTAPSVIELDRPQNILKRILIVVVIAVWHDRDQIEQIAIAQLRSDDVDDFRAAGGFVRVAQSNRQGIAAVDVSALIVAARAQVVVVLLQGADEFVRRLLQVAAVRSGSADVDAMCVYDLSVGRAISSCGSEPNGRTSIRKLAPIIRNTDLQNVELGIIAKARRRIFNSASRRVRRIVIALVGIVIALVRISPAAALNLGHGLRAWIAAQTFFDREELAVVARSLLHAQILCFLIDARVAIGRAGVIAQETATATATALRFDFLKHPCQV